MSLLQERIDPEPSPDRPADAETQRLRAPTVDEAVARARAEFGPSVEIVEANRIRRGGVGGFFATDLGVELVVRPGGDEPARTRRPTRPVPHQPDEYIDSTLALRPIERDDRPPFYDQVIEEHGGTEMTESSAREPFATSRHDTGDDSRHARRETSPAAVERAANPASHRRTTERAPRDEQRARSQRPRSAPEQVTVDAPERHVAKRTTNGSAASAATGTDAPDLPNGQERGEHRADARRRPDLPESTGAPTVTPGVERLLEAATRADGGAADAVTDHGSFDAHLRHQLDRSAAIETTAETAAMNRPSAGVRTEAVDVEPEAASTPGPEAASNGSVSRSGVRPAPGGRSAGRVGAVQLARSTRSRRERRVHPDDESAADVSATDTQDVGRADHDQIADLGEPTGPDDVSIPAEAPEIVRGSAVALVDQAGPEVDTMRRQFDLAAGAVGRLVEQLSDLVPVEGSRVADLSRVTLAVTTPDGNRIEVAAELGRTERG